VAPAIYDKKLYKKRHRVENFFEKIKRMRRVAPRYDKTDVSFMAFVLLAICNLSLRNQFEQSPKHYAQMRSGGRLNRRSHRDRQTPRDR
jgi:hypothetical protein